MKHIDLFSGIGGFALAADGVFGDVEHIFYDNDLFCQEVLKKHWPNSKIYGDIRSFATDTEREGRERELRDTEGQHRLRGGSLEDEKPFLLTGGFPCQPFSQAGRRKGTEDDRYLWPEMFRVIRATNPTWVIAENVRGLVTWNDGMVLETVCSDLEGEGYEVQPLIIPAVAVGAPHRRDRVWVIARHSDGDGLTGRGTEIDTAEGREQTLGDAPGRFEPDWERDWREVALATCHDGVDDGIPRRMGDVTISGARHRKEGLKACGNAIVPQVAEEIMKAIKSSLIHLTV